jgi:ATP-dependent HslUV protease ATP-binding subunit HslU
VAALDRHVVGQAEAKHAVAVALRNRLRRQALPRDLAADVTPKNILLIGPTGVGKTEIARRLARLSGSPFVKVEASKYTEVGYVGRDVESMVRDLVAMSVQMVREEQERLVRDRVERRVEDRLVDLIVPVPLGQAPEADPGLVRRRDAVRTQLRSGHLDTHQVEIEVTESALPQGVSIFSGQGADTLDAQLQGMLSQLVPGKRRRRRVTVEEARGLLAAEESKKLVDDETVNRLAVERAEATGIVFLDELDKIAGRERGAGPDVSREGVQRDLLPIVEGTSVQTKWGPVRTDHVLFIAAGAFHVSKPSDLIPELQGRFPVRVQLHGLSQQDLVRILTEPDSSLTRQAVALLATEGVTLRFTPDGIETMALYAARVNQSAEDIGARRLHTVLETVLEDVSYRADELACTEVVVDAALVHDRLARIAKDQDWSRYVL